MHSGLLSAAPHAPLDLTGVAAAHRGLGAEALIEAAIRRNEGRFAATGGLVVETGLHTGRSAQDKFIVRDETNADTVWWENNKAMERSAFEALRRDFEAHLRGAEMFVQDLHAGADPAHRLPVRIVTELAWHALFIRHLLRRPAASDPDGFEPAFTIVNCPSFRADPARHGCRSETVIAVDLAGRLVLIGGTSYAGETKKSVFGILNYLLPERGVMPMHCSANTAPEGGNAAIFFGLSGTGKTTLSSDPARTLIGDDEHGWSDDGLFNFEGGCYAKTIRLSAQAEPEIYAATTRFGTVLENVAMDGETRALDFDDARLSENARSAYPMHFIPNASETGRAGHPRTIVMLTADAFGVLPPIARLSPAQAMVYFLSGYTAKVAGTEKGVSEPTATFSTCFGAPFMPRHSSVYADLLRERILRHGSTCWLVNTGWTGGAHGEGRRMPIEATRALLSAALDGSLDKSAFRADPNFGFEVPVAVRGVDADLLDPRSTWADGDAYDAQARRLVGMFVTNFEKFRDRAPPDVREAAPRAA